MVWVSPQLKKMEKFLAKINFACYISTNCRKYFYKFLLCFGVTPIIFLLLLIYDTESFKVYFLQVVIRGGLTPSNAIDSLA